MKATLIEENLLKSSVAAGLVLGTSAGIHANHSSGENVYARSILMQTIL